MLEAPTTIDLILDSVSSVFSLVGTVIVQIVSQPVLLFFLASALIPVGIGIFTKLRRSVN